MPPSLAARDVDRLPRHPLGGAGAEEEGRGTEILRRAAKAFKEEDEGEARALMVEYKDDISVHCRRLEEQLVGGEHDDIPGSLGAVLALYMRFLKRIAAHSRNLASSVVNPFDRIGYPE